MQGEKKKNFAKKKQGGKAYGKILYQVRKKIRGRRSLYLHIGKPGSITADLYTAATNGGIWIFDRRN